MHSLTIGIFLLFCGVVWRLRGGAFTTLTGIDPGTQGARTMCAVLITMAAVLMVDRAAAPFEWSLCAIGVAIAMGLDLSGWGPFQGMGIPAPVAPEKSWLRWLPLRLGLPVGSIGHDVIGMAQAGIVCLAPLALDAAWHDCWTWQPAAMTFAAGALFPVPYLLARFIPFPAIPRFASGQAWGEIGAGALVGGAILLGFR